MGCGSCGTGKPNGCKSNGGCSTGGCNRMNTYDWLRNLPISDMEDACRVVEVTFNQGSRKDYYRNAMLHHLEKGDMIAVEGVSGFDVGEVSLTGEIVRLQLKKRGINEMAPDMKKILRRSTDRDIETFKISKVGTIAGCMVLDGKITRNSKIRIIRDGVVVHTGELASLKRFKDDVKEVATGYECGLNIQNYNNIEVGDIVEAYENVEVKRKLT